MNVVISVFIFALWSRVRLPFEVDGWANTFGLAEEQRVFSSLCSGVCAIAVSALKGGTLQGRESAEGAVLEDFQLVVIFEDIAVYVYLGSGTTFRN